MSPARRLAGPFLLLAAALALGAAALTYYPAPGRQAVHQLTLWVVVLAGGGGFWVGYRRLSAAPDGAAARRAVILGALPLWGLAAATEIFDAQDLAAYVNDGWVQVGYGLNPYARPVASIPGWDADPMFVGYWKDTVTAYGFLFSRLGAAVMTAAGADKPAAFALFKLVNLLALAATAWLVDRGCARAGLPRAVGVYLVAWNPLVLLHGLANAHNDLLAGLALTAGVVAAGYRWWWAVFPALAAAALVKYNTLPLFPLAALFLVRNHGWARTALGLAGAAALVAACGWKYLADPAAIEAARNLANVTLFINSLGSAVVVPLQALGKAVPAVAPAVPVVTAALKGGGGLLVLGLVGALAWRRRGEYRWAAFVRDAALVQLVLVAVASPKFYGWYLLMFWPLVGLLPAASRVRRAALAVGVAQLGSFTFLARAHVISPLALIAAPLVMLYHRTRRPGAGRAVVVPFPPPARARAA